MKFPVSAILLGVTCDNITTAKLFARSVGFQIVPLILRVSLILIT